LRKVTKKKYITIVNRHYPPNPGITGEAAWDLAKYLIEKYSVEVRVVCIRKNDAGGGSIRQPVGKVFSIPSIYKGHRIGLKLLAGFFDGLTLIITCLFVKKGTVICMTSPPLLPFWASLFFRIFRVRWFLWTMDLFPEAFVANNKLRANSWLYKFIIKITYSYKPQLLIALGHNQAMHVLNYYKNKPEYIVLPCGVFTEYEKDENKPEWAKQHGKIIFGYCGNLGAPHSVEFLENFIKYMNPEKHHLVLAVYGIHAEKILNIANNKKGISVLSNVPRSLLHNIDVHLVSLLPSFTHTAVPSKGMSAICTGGSMLFCGTEEADTWQLLKEAGWLINIKKEMQKQMKVFCDTITNESVVTRKNISKILSRNLYEMEVRGYEIIFEKL
jgi:hypothetical protein